MLGNRTDLAGRALRKARRASLRFRERVAGLPIRLGNRGLPLPPSSLIYLVGGSNDLAWFLGAGAQAAASIRETLEANGVDLNEVGSILDFGCGAGRVLRHWADLSNTRVCGTDYNPRLVEWSRDNLKFAEVKRNGLTGRVGWPGSTFGLVYALSVFTHLTEPVGLAWIDELARVIRPGGHLLITTHGDHYRPMLDDDQKSRYDSGEAVVFVPDREGTNHCATFHPPAYVRRELARGFEVVDHRPEAALGNPLQDVWLLRKPA